MSTFAASSEGWGFRLTLLPGNRSGVGLGDRIPRLANWHCGVARGANSPAGVKRGMEPDFKAAKKSSPGLLVE